MTTPFVIDNQQHSMASVLSDLLAQHKGHALDIATAYFNVGGWQLLREGLDGLGAFRLLLGDEPEAGADLGLREIGAKPVKGLIRDLAKEQFSEQTLRLVEDLVAFLRRPQVQVRLYTKGFLHAKCYLFYSGGGFARFNPVAAIVELTGGRGADYAFEAIGNVKAARQVFDMVRPGGTAVIVGMLPQGSEIAVPGPAFLSEKKMIGSFYGSTRQRVDMPRLLNFIVAVFLIINGLIGLGLLKWLHL